MRTTLIVITAFIVVPFLFRIVRKKSVRLCQKLGSPNERFHTRLFKKNRFRKFVSETTDLWIERESVVYWYSKGVSFETYMAVFESGI
jgi:hypothetical protein